MPTTVVLRDQEIRNILAGHQTMVMRPVGGATVHLRIGVAGLTKPDKENVIRVGESELWRADGGLWRKKCPFGVEGTKLVVRETWAQPGAVPRSDDPLRPDGPVVYRADGGRDETWRSPTTMPVWASRLEIEVKEVRVARLHEITEAEALKNGVRLIGGRYSHNGGLTESRTPIEAYRAAWESSEDLWAWEENPHVWAVSFSAMVIDRSTGGRHGIVPNPAIAS